MKIYASKSNVFFFLVCPEIRNFSFRRDFNQKKLHGGSFLDSKRYFVWIFLILFRDAWYDFYKNFYIYVGGKKENVQKYKKICKLFNEIKSYYEKHSKPIIKTVDEPSDIKDLFKNMGEYSFFWFQFLKVVNSNSPLFFRSLREIPSSLRCFYTLTNGQNTQFGKYNWNLGFFGFYSFYDKNSS